MATIQGAFSGSGGWVGTRLDYYEKSSNVANNTSVVHVDFYIVSINNGYTTSAINGGTAYITVNGETKTLVVPNKWTIAKGEVWKIGEHDFIVGHNSDGTKTTSVGSSSSTGMGSSSLNGSLKLTDIPRASSVSCSDFYIESSTTININSANSNFRHTLKYSFGSLSGTIVEKTALTSYGWTPNASNFYKQIGNNLTKVGTITCETYNGNTLLGTKTCNFTARIDGSKCMPILDTLTVIDTNETTKALTGNENTLIKYFSKVKAEFTATFKNGATQQNYVLNNIYYKTSVVTLDNIEINKFDGYVQDSRGIFSLVKTVTNNFIDYVKLAIKSATIERTAPTEDQIRLDMQGFYFNGSFGAVANTLNLKIKYKEEYGEWSEYYSITPNISENNTFNLQDYNLNELFGNASFDYQKSYVFKFVVNDKLITLNQEVPLKKGLPVAAFGEDFVRIYGDLELKSGNVVLDYDVIDEWENQKSIKYKDNIYLDSTSIVHKKNNLCDVLTNNVKIVDVTESLNGRTITSKIPFNKEGIMFFIFQAVSAWSNHVLQIAIFDSTSANISIVGNWESSYVFFYNSIFEIVNNNQIRVKKYAQGTNVAESKFSDANDSDYGAIRPNKIYAVMFS